MKSPLESKTDEEWGIFIRKTCHDVRTPLTTLQGYGELTLKKPSNELAEKVSQQALRSVFEVELFLLLLSWRQKKMHFSFEEVSIEKIFVDAIEWVKSHVNVDQLEFVPPMISHQCILDRKRILQACIAVLLEFMQEVHTTDKIRIQIQSTETNVCLSFATSGTLLHAGSIEDREVGYRVLFAQQVFHAHRAKMKWSDASAEMYFPIVTGS